MQKIILILLISISLYGSQNIVTEPTSCSEFKAQADYYYNKANYDKFYSERYIKIGDYYTQMYKQCIQQTEQKKSYSGYRDNIIQQQIQK